MPSVSPIRVLVVDDEDDMRRLFRLALEYDDNFAVVGDAADGLDAARLAAELVPEAVVLDWAMPRLGGAAALVEIKAAAPAARVVVVSAHERADVESAAREAGADAYLEKTHAIDALPAVLRRLCREEVDLREAPAPAPSRGPDQP